MRSCRECKHQYYCKYREQFLDIVTNGLKCQQFNAYDSNNQNAISSQLDILDAVGRSCLNFEDDCWFQLSDQMKLEAKKMADNLKNDKEFLDEFLMASSTRGKCQVIDSYLDEEEISKIIKNNLTDEFKKEVYEKQKKYLTKNETADDLSSDDIYNSFEKQVKREFGY